MHVCLQVRKLSRESKLSQNGMPRGPGGTPRMGSPTVANTKERAQTFMPACMLPFFVELSYFPLHFTKVAGWRVVDRSRLPGCLSRCSDSLGNCLPGQVALPSAPTSAHSCWILYPFGATASQKQVPVG